MISLFPPRRLRPGVSALLALICLLPRLAMSQTLAVSGDVQTYTSLTNTTVTMTGKSELRITGTGDPLTGCTVALNSADSWLFLTNIAPATVSTTFFSRITVNGAAAVLDSNVRVVQYGIGAVVIPHAPSFTPLTVYEGKSFTGVSRALGQYTAYGWAELGTLNDAISSFKLKRGYMATLASNPDGTGTSRNYVAADGDLEIGVLPTALNNSVSFVRIFPWRWVTKKGTCDTDPVALKASWNYNWNINSNSTLNWEYVAIKQQRYWPGLAQDWKARGVNHVSGFNEPDNPVEDAYTSLDNGSTTTAVAAWPDLLGTGLRVGAPAVTDGGTSWILDFMNKANAAGVRVDYVPVHYYRSYWNNNDPASAANNLYNFLKTIHDATGKPLWLTEFNNGANWTTDADPTVDQNKNVIEAMVNMMDNTWWIERYSVYSDVEWFRRTHYDDGSFTPMGAMYRDHVAPMSYLQEIPSAGVSAAAHYAFDGDLRDGLMNGNDGMAVGAPDFVAGKSGQAVSLNGTSDYIQLAAPLGDSNDFTFAGWINWNGGGNWQRIFDFGNGGTDNYVCLTPKSGSNTLRFIVKQAGTEQIVESSTLPTIGAWTHVAVTISNTTARIFVNGVLRGTNTAFTFDPGAQNTQYNYLGKSQWPDPLFSGKLDDLRFLTTALSDAQIASLAGAAPPQFGAVLYNETATRFQPFTGSLAVNASGGSGARVFTKAAGPAWLVVAADGSLTGVPGANDGGVNRFVIRVTDSFGSIATTTLEVAVTDPQGLVARYALDGNVNADTGVLNGTTTGTPVYAAGVNGQSIDLDGADDYVTLPAGIANENEITIAAWYWRDSTAGWQRLFDFGTGTGQYMFLSPRSGSANIHFGIKNGGAEQSLTYPSLPTGQWVHVAVTLGGNTGKLYVNGVLRDTDTIAIKPTDFLHEFNYLGKSQFADPLMDGRIDEFQVFNKVLDGTQVAALANQANRAPTFATDPISKAAAVPGQIYEQSIAGSATDPNPGSTLTYSKIGGPRWLTVSPDGRISGVPGMSDAGTNRFTVRVTDSTGLADDAALNIVVSAPSGLIAHYQFHSSPGDTAGSWHGTANGGPAYTNGLFDQAIDLDGTDDLVTLPAGIVSSLNDMTITARFRWDGGNNWQRLFDFGNGTGNYLFVTPSNGGVLRFAIKNGGAEQTLNAQVANIGEWTHLAVTLIGDAGRLYVNGTLVDTQTITLNPSNIAPLVNYIGDSQFAADPLFNGAIDDFRIYNSGLNAAEVYALASPPAATIVPDSSYAAWASGFVFPSGQSGAAADPDKDQLPNAWEYLLGSNPLAAGTNAMPVGVIRSASSLGLAGNKTHLSTQARVRRQRFGTTITPLAAPTIAGLSAPDAPSHALQAGSPVSDGDFEIITYYYDEAIEDSPDHKAFMRIRAVTP